MHTAPDMVKELYRIDMTVEWPKTQIQRLHWLDRLLVLKMMTSRSEKGPPESEYTKVQVSGEACSRRNERTVVKLHYNDVSTIT
jgi:hypothetical protein